MVTNLYKVLGVKDFATAKECAKAYRKKALTAHPDRNPKADPAEFHKILEAHETLKDPTKKSIHDLRLKNSRRVPLVDMFGNAGPGPSPFSHFRPPPKGPYRPAPENRTPFGWQNKRNYENSSPFINFQNLFGKRRYSSPFGSMPNFGTYKYQWEAWGRRGDLSSEGEEAETDLNKKRRARQNFYGTKRPRRRAPPQPQPGKKRGPSWKAARMNFSKEYVEDLTGDSPPTEQKTTGKKRQRPVEDLTGDDDEKARPARKKKRRRTEAEDLTGEDHPNPPPPRSKKPRQPSSFYDLTGDDPPTPPREKPPREAHDLTGDDDPPAPHAPRQTQDLTGDDPPPRRSTHDLTGDDPPPPPRKKKPRSTKDPTGKKERKREHPPKPLKEEESEDSSEDSDEVIFVDLPPRKSRKSSARMAKRSRRPSREKRVKSEDDPPLAETKPPRRKPKVRRSPRHKAKSGTKPDVDFGDPVDLTAGGFGDPVDLT